MVMPACCLSRPHNNVLNIHWWSSQLPVIIQSIKNPQKNHLLSLCPCATRAVFRIRCFIDGCDDVQQCGLDYFTPPWLNNTIPGWGDESSSSESRLKRQCYFYNQTWNNVEECIAGSNVDIDQEIECSEWVYDDSIFGSTIVTEVI
jgi:hypothetical protein